jgi:cyclopropane-fatty-acyl-phospholipid synthase
MQLALELAERGLLPDWLIRSGIRRLLASRLRELATAGSPDAEQATREFARAMQRNPLVVAADAANAQHYEVPTEFFVRTLGRRLKYSCGFWPAGVETLDESEEAMLELTCQRAGLEDGMRVLDLGCGWGALTLWLAERYPRCQIDALSNSATQRAHIEGCCRERGFDRVRVTTGSVADFAPSAVFDRIVSVEMFEHVRNYDELLSRIRQWLAPDGRLFVHVFCHRARPYYFEPASSGDWMARHFFTGGLMPSRTLLGEFPDRMTLEEQWTVSGTHYQRTCEAWLAKLDADRAAVERAFAQSSPAEDSRRLAQRWRMFYMACAELFGFRGGDEWHVAHYLLRPPTAP